MNVHFSYKQAVKGPQEDKIINRRVEKLQKLLANFSPELVHLHGALEFRNPREGFYTSLNLRLPVGQLYATEAGKTAQVSLRAAFDDLEQQFQKKMGLLRESKTSKTRRTMEETGEAEARKPPRKPKRPAASFA